MIESWIASGSGEVQENLASPAVQPVSRIGAERPGACRRSSRWPSASTSAGREHSALEARSAYEVERHEAHPATGFSL